jgi:alpha-L-rhamnosidase
VLFVNNKYKWKNIMQKMNGLLTWSGRHSCLLMAFLQIGLFFQQVKASDLPQITNLRTEYKINPLGIDAAQPRFSWEIVSGKRNFTQKAFQIRASKLEKDLLEGKNLMWDSGKILSDKSSQVVYNGMALKSGQRVYWQVKIWAKDGSESGWSKASFWEMGLLNVSDWQAEWIEPQLKENENNYNPCPLLRNEFEISKSVKSARAYVTSHGLYEFHINGDKVGNQLFTPGWTSYNKRLQYQTYDVTDNIQQGKNAIGVILGDGWYRGPLTWDMKKNNYGEKLGLLLQINITYTDGTTAIIKSGSAWKSAAGPILMSEIYDGETYDARLEINGWDKPGFDDKDWSRTAENEYSKEILIASGDPPIRVTQSIKPVKEFKTPNGDLVIDMGQNMVGWVQFKLKGSTGDKITFRHAEVLDKDGNIYTANLRRAQQKVEYIFKGKDVEIFHPHFTFQGFRYVAVTDYPGEISLDNISGEVIHSDMAPTGNFECSDSLINQLQKNIQWGLRGNFLGIPTDCPQRDERLGWTGDAEVFAPTACFNMDAAAFYTKWMKDFIADQLDDGRIPHVIPNILGNDGGAAGWADAAVIIPWTVYQNYGDIRILETQYESMKAWIKYLKKNAGDSYLWKKAVGFGDWLAFATTASDYPGATTDKDMIGTAYFYHSTSLLQKIALILGKKQDAKEYTVLMKKIKNAFQLEFITQTGRLASNTQTAYSLALDFDLVPENLIAKAAKRLADDVNNFGHLTTGFLGTSRINRVLSNNGYTDLAYMLLFRKEYPSWLYPVTKGATTIWERWDGIKPDSSFQDPGMNSFNHYAYGAVGKWLYSSVAGIDIDPNKPGYKNIIVNPHITKKLKFAKAEYHSIYGMISSGWRNENDSVEIDIQVPPNTTADVFMPTGKIGKIFESGKPVKKLKEIQSVKLVDGKIILHIGSGKYFFVIKD